MASLFRLLMAAIWVGASVFLATDVGQGNPTLRIAAAVIVGVPNAARFVGEVAAAIGRPSTSSEYRVKRLLQSALNGIDDQGLYGGDIKRVSFHVWVLPLWFRRLVPKVLRRRLIAASPNTIRLLRPRLVKLAMFRFCHHEESGVTQRVGVGLVGRCVSTNNSRQIFGVDFASQEMQEALATAEAWEDGRREMTRGLRYSDARVLSKLYSQVAAVVLRDGADAIGCITLEAPAGADVSFPSLTPRDAGSELYKKLVTTGGLVEVVLTKSGT